jgi:CRISPR/Cas system CMR subunit Cmr4 (Cas7 group RAMP superfamily)
VTTKVDRIQIDYLLKFEAPFHCGTGIRIGLIDRSIVRDSNDYLYVPGSTFKGVLRERCEQLARFYEQDEQVKLLVQSPHEARAALQSFGQTATMVTRIFGSQTYPGRLFFDDARQLPGDLQQYDSPEKGGQGKYKGLQTDLYTQVRLDRPTRTAVKGALYTSEFGLADLRFTGSIKGWLECTAIDHSSLVNKDIPDNSPTYSHLLLLAGLQMIEHIGGNKSTGKGRCSCEITKVMLNDSECEGTQWQSWLEQLDTLAFYYLA